MDIRIEDVPYDLHTMVDIIGMEKFEELSKFYGGASVYIPIHNKLVMGCRNRNIVKEYNGKNLKLLRAKYGISEQQVKRIIMENGD